MAECVLEPFFQLMTLRVFVAQIVIASVVGCYCNIASKPAALKAAGGFGAQTGLEPAQRLQELEHNVAAYVIQVSQIRTALERREIEPDRGPDNISDHRH